MNDLILYSFLGGAALLLAGMIYTAIKPSKCKFSALNIGATAIMVAFFWCYFSGLFRKMDMEGMEAVFLISMCIVSYVMVIAKSCRINLMEHKSKGIAVPAVVGIGGTVLSFILMVPFLEPGLICSLAVGVLVSMLLFDAVGGFNPAYIFGGFAAFIGIIIAAFCLRAAGLESIDFSIFMGDGFHILLFIELIPAAIVLQLVLLFVPYLIIERRREKLDVTPESPEQP